MPCRRQRAAFAAFAPLFLAAVPAFAGGDLAPSPASRTPAEALERYLDAEGADVHLVGGPGSAGHGPGFWIRSGEFSLHTTLLFQARYEAYRWTDAAARPAPGGDLSGFSLPRSALILRGTAPCRMRYLALLEFGHHGGPDSLPANAQTGAYFTDGVPQPGGMPGALREGWVEHEVSPALCLRMGMIKLASTRQLGVPATRQQFVDVSLASAYVGHAGIGYLDRNRDFGIMAHGSLGRRSEFEYEATVSNGDGATVRNVLNPGTSDNLAFTGRVDWHLVGHHPWLEGATLNRTCDPRVSVGAWAQYYADQASDKPHRTLGDRFVYGLDAAVGLGGLSFTAAWSGARQTSSDLGVEWDGHAVLLQAGYLFPGTAWEVAARWSLYRHDTEFAGTYGAREVALALNYYLNGYASRLTLDVAWIQAREDGHFLSDVMAGYNANPPSAPTSDATLLRFQWQLVL